MVIQLDTDGQILAVNSPLYRASSLYLASPLYYTFFLNVFENFFVTKSVVQCHVAMELIRIMHHFINFMNKVYSVYWEKLIFKTQ
jgi:hypothetical protein